MNASYPDEWDFAGIVLTIFLAALYGRIGRAAPFWQILWRFPGTALHELAHFLVAFVTGGRPIGFTVIPVPRDAVRADGSPCREWVLGSVTLRNPGVFSALPSGLAPLLLVPLAWEIYRHWFHWFPRDLPNTLCLYAAVCLFCCSSVPSGRDFRVAFSSLAGVAFYGALIAAAFFLLRI